MKYALVLLLGLSVIRCAKHADAVEQVALPVCKLVAAKTEWFNGQLCPAKNKLGVNYKAQGSGINGQGYTVVGCYTEAVECK